MLELSLSHRSQILHFHFLPSHKSAELTTMTASKVLSSKALKFPPIIMKSRAHIVTLFSPVRLRNLKFCSSFSPPKWKVTQGFLLRSESTQKRGSRDGHACLRLEKTMIRWRGKSSLLKVYLDCYWSISSKIARFQKELLTCVKLRYCARDGGGTKGSVQLGKVRFVDSGDVPVVRHPETI